MKHILKVLIVSTVFMFGTMSVSAHSLIQQVSPQAGEIFTESPAHFSIQYSKSVRLVKLNLFDQSDRQIALPDKLLRHESNKHVIKFPQLSVGTYRLTWILMGSDGHKMKGKTNFSIIDK